jgi:hypothetical protein
MKKIAFSIALGTLAAASLTPSIKAATIANWDFDAAGTQAAGDNTPSAAIGNGTATQLGMTNSYIYAGGEGPGSAASCDVLATAGASTGSGAFAWRIRGNGNSANSGAGVANGWNSNAPLASQGAEFMVNTANFSSLQLQVDVNATGQAERNLTIEYTLNDTASTPVWALADITSAGSAATLENNSSSSNTVDGNYVELSGAGTGWNNLITATFPGVSNDPNFAFEVVNASTGADDVNTSGATLNNSSGNWRLDNVDLTGVTAAVPEPSTWATAGLGLLALLGGSRLRRFFGKA